MMLTTLKIASFSVIKLQRESEKLNRISREKGSFHGLVTRTEDEATKITLNLAIEHNRQTTILNLRQQNLSGTETSAFSKLEKALARFCPKVC